MGQILRFARRRAVCGPQRLVHIHPLRLYVRLCLLRSTLPEPSPRSPSVAGQLSAELLAGRQLSPQKLGLHHLARDDPANNQDYYSTTCCNRSYCFTRPRILLLRLVGLPKRKPPALLLIARWTCRFGYYQCNNDLSYTARVLIGLGICTLTALVLAQVLTSQPHLNF